MREINKEKYHPRGNLIKVALFAIKRELKLRKQRTFCYCPYNSCFNELCAGGNLISYNENGVTYICSVCGTESLWNFDTPAPLLISFK